MTIFDDFNPESFYQGFEENQEEGRELSLSEQWAIYLEVENLHNEL